MSRFPAPAAVLFDLDGTLVDSERENVESVVLACRRLGAELSDEERRFVIGHSWNEIHARISARHGITLTMPALIAMAVDEKRALMARTGYRALRRRRSRRCGVWPRDARWRLRRGQAASRFATRWTGWESPTVSG